MMSHLLVFSKLLLCFFFLIGSGCSAAHARVRVSLPPLPNPDYTAKVLSRQANALNPCVLRLALNAYNHARLEGYDYKQILTVIDYTKSSGQTRFWVFDLAREKLLFHELVAHGRNSGMAFAKSFSNQPNSLKSSIGVYTTGQPYFGQQGYSLRLMGMEPGFNDNAYERALVVHGAWYVNPSIARERGYVGRSWGCPALSPKAVKPVIDTIAYETVIFAYYPDQRWLHSSRFLES